MSDSTQPRYAYRRRSVFESDNDLIDSATGYQAYPSPLVSSGRLDSYPSISGLRPTKESTYIRTGARSQSQNLLSEIRAANVFDRFQSLRTEIDYWEYELKTQCFSFDEINEQFDSLVKNVNILAKEAILANVDLTVCGQISECRTTVQRLKRNALYHLESHENMDSHCQDSKSEDGLRDEIDLSFRGQVIDNAGQRSLLPFSFDINDDCLGLGHVVGNAGQQSPLSIPGSNYELSRGGFISPTRSQVADNSDQ